MEAERLSVYFEEVGAYEHKKYNSPQNRASAPNEITEFTFEDQEADVYINDEFEE